MNYTLSDLYRMYKRATEEAGYCRQGRSQGSFGIAVANDKYARRFQKWHTLARRLDVVIRERIAEIEHRQESTRQHSRRFSQDGEGVPQIEWSDVMVEPR